MKTRIRAGRPTNPLPAGLPITSYTRVLTDKLAIAFRQSRNGSETIRVRDLTPRLFRILGHALKRRRVQP